MTKISDIMTREPNTIDVRDPLTDALRALDNAPYHHLIVMENYEPIGMVSSTDIYRLLHELDADMDGSFSSYLDQQYTLEDAMSPGLHSVQIDDTVADAARLLSSGSFHSVAVLDETDLVGIVTTTDLAKYIVAKEG
jgi:CBS domain-containing protein